MEAELGKADWFAGNEFTAADIQMSFPLEAAKSRAGLDASRPRCCASSSGSTRDLRTGARWSGAASTTSRTEADWRGSRVARARALSPRPLSQTLGGDGRKTRGSGGDDLLRRHRGSRGGALSRGRGTSARPGFISRRTCRRRARRDDPLAPLRLRSIDARAPRVMACVVRAAVMQRSSRRPLPRRGVRVHARERRRHRRAPRVRHATSLALGAFPGLIRTIAPTLDAKALARRGQGAQLRAARKVDGQEAQRALDGPRDELGYRAGESVRVDIVAPGNDAPHSPRGEGRFASLPGRRRAIIDLHHRGRGRRGVGPSNPPLIPRCLLRACVPRRWRRQVKETARSAAPGKGGDDEGLTRMLDDLLSALILPPEEDARRKGVHHISGQIATHASADAVLRSSRWSASRGCSSRGATSKRFGIYVDGGQIVDIEPLAANETARARLRSSSPGRMGPFEFDIMAVNRPNRIGMSMTALLLDLARGRTRRRGMRRADAGTSASARLHDAVRREVGIARIAGRAGGISGRNDLEGESHAASAYPADDPRRRSDDEREVGDVARDDRTGADERVAPHRVAAEDGAVRAERRAPRGRAWGRTRAFAETCARG